MDRPFEGPKGLFIAKIDRSGCENDPFGDPIGPPEEEIDPFRDTNDWLNGKKDFFRKERIISVNNRSFSKIIDHFSQRKTLRM